MLKLGQLASSAIGNASKSEGQSSLGNLMNSFKSANGQNSVGNMMNSFKSATSTGNTNPNIGLQSSDANSGQNPLGNMMNSFKSATANSDGTGLTGLRNAATNIMKQGSAKVMGMAMPIIIPQVRALLEKVTKNATSSIGKFIPRLLIVDYGLNIPILGKLLEKPLRVPQFLPFLMLIKFVGCMERRIRNVEKLSLLDIENSQSAELLKTILQDVVQDIENLATFLERYIEHRLETAGHENENIEEDMSTNDPEVQEGIREMQASLKRILSKIISSENPMLQQCLTETMIDSIPIKMKFNEFLNSSVPQTGGKPTSKIIVYQNRRYKVYKSEEGHKYIQQKGQPIMLRTIRGKYTYEKK